MPTPTENFELEPDRLDSIRRLESSPEEAQFYQDLDTRSVLYGRRKAKVIAQALRNMARAVEQQFYQDEAGTWMWNGEMSVSMAVNHGLPWRGSPATEYGVFDAWVRFSVGPNAVATDDDMPPFQTLEEWEKSDPEYRAIQDRIDAYLNREKLTPEEQKEFDEAEDNGGSMKLRTPRDPYWVRN